MPCGVPISFGSIGLRGPGEADARCFVPDSVLRLGLAFLRGQRSAARLRSESPVAAAVDRQVRSGAEWPERVVVPREAAVAGSAGRLRRGGSATRPHPARIIIAAHHVLVPHPPVTPCVIEVYPCGWKAPSERLRLRLGCSIGVSGQRRFKCCERHNIHATLGPLRPAESLPFAERPMEYSAELKPPPLDDRSLTSTMPPHMTRGGAVR